MEEEKKEELIEQPQISKVKTKSRMRRNSCIALQFIPATNQLALPQSKETESELDYKKRYSCDYTDKTVILMDIKFNYVDEIVP